MIILILFNDSIFVIPFISGLLEKFKKEKEEKDRKEQEKAAELAPPPPEPVKEEKIISPKGKKKPGIKQNSHLQKRG